MRLQKIVIISTLVGLNFSSAFSQTERKSSEDFFRENSARSATDDKLAEILRKKQAELDAKENAAHGTKPPAQPVATSPTTAPVEPHQPKAVVPPAPVTPAVATSVSEDRLEEVLRKKQAELDAKENVVPPRQPVSQPKVTPAKPVVVEPKPEKVIVAQPAVDSAAEARLVEALRKKQAELDAKEQVATPRLTPAVTPAKQAETTKAEAKKAAAVAKEREESEKRIQKIEADIKAKEEAIKKRAAAQSKSAPVVQPDVSAQKAEAVDAALQAKPESKAQVTKSKQSKKQAFQAPAPDLSTKEGRLTELLRRYKADEITPHDYHLERAKILAEP